MTRVTVEIKKSVFEIPLAQKPVKPVSTFIFIGTIGKEIYPVQFLLSINVY